MAAKYCLNVGMESTGILVIECRPKLNTCTTIPTPPCHTIWLANLLADVEIAWARDGYIVAGVEENYYDFVRDHLQGCLVDRMVFLFPSKIKFLFCKFLFHIFAW